jgi:hypothetical protein
MAISWSLLARTPVRDSGAPFWAIGGKTYKFLALQLMNTMSGGGRGKEAGHISV